MSFIFYTEVTKKLATVVSVAAAPEAKIFETTDGNNRTSSATYQMSEECIKTLTDLEASDGGPNSEPILIQILKCVKSNESKINFLCSELEMIKKGLNMPRDTDFEKRMMSFIHTPTIKNSTPKPLKTDATEDENDHELALPLITKPQQFSSHTEDVQYSSLGDTATLISNSNLILNGNNMNSECDISSMELVENRYDVTESSNARGFSVPEDKEMCNLEKKYCNRTQCKVTDVRIWNLTLAQLDEAKPWSHHSLSQACQSPDPNLSKVDIGDCGEIPASLISQCKERATEYLIKNKKSTAAGVIANETCKQITWRLFLLKEVWNHNINDTNQKYALDSQRIRAVCNAHQSLISTVSSNSMSSSETFKTYINTRLRKQIYTKLLNLIDASCPNE